MRPRNALRVNRHLVIPFDELEWTFATSGGPGGQHANRAATRVEVRFDVERSTALGPRQRQRLLERLGPTVRASAREERSQTRNREIALDRLGGKLADALRVERPRVATRPSGAARKRRVEAKRQRGEVKRFRRKPDVE